MDTNSAPKSDNSSGKKTPIKQSLEKQATRKQSLEKETPRKQSLEKQNPGKQTPGKQNPGKQTPGKQISGKPTPGKQTPGKRYGNANRSNSSNHQFEPYMPVAVIRARGLASSCIGPGSLLQATLRYVDCG